MSKKPSFLSSALRFIILLSLKVFCLIFYRLKVKNLNERNEWQSIKLIVLLNHTSLFELVFIGLAPVPFLWELAKHLSFPAADITYNRKIFGPFLRALGVSVQSVTRKRDDSWYAFLDSIHKDAVVVLAPEGRMKRRGGLDKDGKPMTIRGGIVDILPHFKEKEMLFIYSGGLHHVLAPGDKFIKPFKKIHVALEKIKVSDYMKKFQTKDGLNKEAVIKDLEKRRDLYCPKKREKKTSP